MSRKRIRGKDKLAFCKECVKTNDCRLQFDKEHRRECPLMRDDEPLRYRNSEGYSDPTAYFALLNAMKKPKQEEKEKQRRPRTQVVYYD